MHNVYLHAFIIISSIIITGCGFMPLISAFQGHDPYMEQCVRLGGTEADCEKSLREAESQQHTTVVANTPEVWKTLEARARELAAAHGGMLQDVIQVKGSGVEVYEVIHVEPGCYTVGVASASPYHTYVTTSFGETNMHMPGRRYPFKSSDGSFVFCADKAGEIKLHFNATDPHVGFLINDTLLEFAVVPAYLPESPEERNQRQALELKEFRDGMSKVEQNLRELDTRRYGRASAHSCAKCRSSYYACRELRDTKTCWPTFELCAQAQGRHPDMSLHCASPSY